MNKDIAAISNYEIDMIEFICNNYIHSEEDKEELIQKYMRNYGPEDILLSREVRVDKQSELIQEYGRTLINIRVNYPGVQKNNYITLGIIKILCSVIFKEFKGRIKYKDFDIAAEGPIITLVVDGFRNEIKKKTIDIEENHFLGRYVDIDVYDKDGTGISRTDLGLESRRCYICNDFAQNCVRGGRHSTKEIKEHIRNKYEIYLSQNNIKG